VGKPIVYCSGCRKQIRQQEFDEGAAFRVRERVCCSRCARKEVRRLPETARRAILARSEAARTGSGKGTNTSRILRALVLSRAGFHPRATGASGSRMLGYLLGAAGVFLVLAVLFASAHSAGNRSRGARPALPAPAQQR
jgi:hypothetical protein